MIKIDNEYIINANENCYTLEKIGKIEDINSKNYGNETRTIYGYYTTLENSLKGYVEAKTRKYVSAKTFNTLQELITQIKQTREVVKNLMKGE